MKGSPVDPNRIYASQTSGWFGQIIQRSDDGGKTWHQPGTPAGSRPQDAAGHAQGREQQVRLRHVARDRQAAHDAPVVRRHAAPLGVQTRLAPGAVADRPGHRLRRRRRRRPLPLDRRRQDLARARRPPRPRHGPKWQPGAGGMGLHTIVLDPTNPAAHLHRHLRGRRLPHRRRRQDLEGRSTSGLKSQYIPDPNAEVGFCVHRIAMHPSRPGHAVHAAAPGRACAPTTPATTGTKSSGNLPTDFGFPIDVHAHEPDTVYVVPIDQRLAALSARGQAARLPQPHRRQRVGAARPRACRRRTATSTCCATRWPSIRSTSAASTSAPPAARSTAPPDGGDNWIADRPRPAGGAVGGGADAELNSGCGTTVPRLVGMSICEKSWNLLGERTTSPSGRGRPGKWIAFSPASFAHTSG